MKLIIERDGKVAGREFQQGEVYQVPKDLEWSWAYGVCSSGVGRMEKEVTG